MSAERALLYARTLRHLRPTQILGRVWKHVHRPRPDLSAPPPRREPDAPRAWRAPAVQPACLTGPTRLRLLGVEREVEHAADWNDPTVPKLWLYHLHYFDDLVAEDAPRRADWHARLLASWLAANPPGEGNGWEPYPTSRRIVNWIRWSLSGGELSPEAMASLAVQARWLAANLEHHLLGNHLFANAKALVFAGLFFDGPEAEGWLARGLRLVERELVEQVLSDGGHFERSPMYHATVLCDVLDLVVLGRTFGRARSGALETAADRWRRVADRMRRWLACMVHPDGEIALFNDAALGHAPSPGALERYAAELGLASVEAPGDGAVVLEATGYVRYRRGALFALLDVGEIGPGYLPGHAHADTLSFELSLGRARLAVDTGTSVYRVCDERRHQRSTGAHNTVEVDGADSSEVWGSFRVARRARPLGLTLEDTAEGFEVRCAHDGYRRLPGRVLHRRAWCFGPDALRILDRVDGRHGRAVARLHLHPDVGVEREELLLPGQRVRWRAETGRPRWRATTWHPAFGASLPNRCLELELEAGRAELALCW